MPDIDVTDWEKNTDYSSGYEPDTPVIQVRVHAQLLSIHATYDKALATV